MGIYSQPIVVYSGFMGRTTVPSGGLEGPNRALLGQLHRGTSGPFKVAEAAEVLKLPRERARRLLAYLAGRGWLSRVSHGVYTTVPLGGQLFGLTEVFVQSLLLAVVLFYWVTHPEKRWITWVLGTLLVIVLLLPTLGLLVG